MTVKVRTMNTSVAGIAPETTNRPHVVMRVVEKDMSQNIAHEVGTEVGGAVVTRGIDVKRAKSALQ
jgi:hypothetical protein